MESATLTIADIMPKPQRLYDKNRAPKLVGQPTVAYFHVTGMNTTAFCGVFIDHTLLILSVHKLIKLNEK